MAASTDLRPPAVAGRFYEAAPQRCQREADRLCAAPDLELPDTLYGAVVPHAGWVCSGRIAGETWRALAQRTEATTVLLSGSVHTMRLERPALDSARAWQSPLGPVAVNEPLREAVAALEPFETVDAAHAAEHSLEVQLPLIQTCFGGSVRVVPLLIPAVAEAVEWGRALGRLLVRWPEPTVVVASSDLTHYGPNYRFTPEGPGEVGRLWADRNDRRLLKLLQTMDAGSLVAETHARHNACGGGALAATVAASAELGARRGLLIEHTNSWRELRRIGHADEGNSVGYAGVVFS